MPALNRRRDGIRDKFAGHLPLPPCAELYALQYTLLQIQIQKKKRRAAIAAGQSAAGVISISSLPRAPATLTNLARSSPSPLLSTLLHSQVASTYSGTIACNPTAFGPALSATATPCCPTSTCRPSLPRRRPHARRASARSRTDRLDQTRGPPWSKRTRSELATVSLPYVCDYIICTNVVRSRLKKNLRTFFLCRAPRPP